MDADNEVIRVWKRRKATNLNLLKDDEYAEAVSGRNELYKALKVKFVCVPGTNHAESQNTKGCVYIG